MKSSGMVNLEDCNHSMPTCRTVRHSHSRYSNSNKNPNQQWYSNQNLNQYQNQYPNQYPNNQHSNQYPIQSSNSYPNQHSNQPLYQNATPQYNNPPPKAHLTSAQSSSQNWYPDSDASHHVTNVSQNIQPTTPFEGPDQIIIVNGQGLNINSSSVTSFKFPLRSHIPLVLNNLLFVPSITKNLMRSCSCHVFPCYKIPLLQRMTKTLNQHHHQFNTRKTNTLGTSISKEKNPTWSNNNFNHPRSNFPQL